MSLDWQFRKLLKSAVPDIFMACPYLLESGSQFICKITGKICTVTNYPTCLVFKSRFFGGAHRPVRTFKRE